MAFSFVSFRRQPPRLLRHVYLISELSGISGGRNHTIRGSFYEHREPSYRAFSLGLFVLYELILFASVTNVTIIHA